MTIWKKSRRVRNELRSLSLRELADLGFVPADIRFAPTIPTVANSSSPPAPAHGAGHYPLKRAGCV
jgi:hypothetical protein